MPAPYEGGCQCGRVRYRVTTEPDTLYVCHCRECQTQSASAFGMSMTVARDGVSLTQGETAAFNRTAASGNDVVCTFCPACGTRLFHETSGRPDKINVKPGTLDDTGWLHPVAHVWTGAAQAWVAIPEGVLRFATQPPSHDVLVAAYRQRGRTRTGCRS